MSEDDRVDAFRIIQTYTSNAIQLGAGNPDTYLAQRDALAKTLAAALEEAKDGGVLDSCLERLRALTIGAEEHHA